MASSPSQDSGEPPRPDSPSSPLSDVSTPSPSTENPPAPHVPNAPVAGMTSSSTPLGAINAARRPAPPQATMSGRGTLPQDLQARMKAFHLGRQGPPPSLAGRSPAGMPQVGTPPVGPAAGPQAPGAPQVALGGVPANVRLPSRPSPQGTNSSPAIPGNPAGKMSLAEKRNMPPPGGLASAHGRTAAPAGKKRPGLTLSQMNNGDAGSQGGGSVIGKPASGGSLMDKYSEFLDKKTGALRFKGKATLTSQGVEFSSGSSFNISLDEVDSLDELGKGNYGTVFKVRHSRPRMRRPGQGLAGNKAPSSQQTVSSTPSSASPTSSSFRSASETSLSKESSTSSDTPATPTSVTANPPAGGTTGVVMAMKEIRLELDEAKFAAIIMELDILHRCVSPFIIDFYGAFFQEGAVYICMEFMNGGSIDKLYGDGTPESVLRKITLSVTMGLKSLKDEHNIIHRDVKPTNILVNTAGQVKLCDFGVSGNLVASIAKTNIGCQSYMAPERISSGGIAQAGAPPSGGTYSVQSDIWSLGLSITECALGQYPYPPETYDNIFSQLSAIVDGQPPDLPASFSPEAHDFVKGCLMKIPKLRPTYAMLLQHAWLAPLLKPPAEQAPAEGAPGEETTPSTADPEVAAWVVEQLEKRRKGALGKKATPALHAAPLDAAVGKGSPVADAKTDVEAQA